MIEHVREIFDSLPVAFPERDESKNMRIINYEILSGIIRKIYNDDLYQQGYEKGFDDAAEVSSKVISRIFSKSDTSYAEEAHAEKA